MKRFLILLSMLLLSLRCISASAEIPLDLQKKSDLIASKILYSFILKDNGWEKPSAVIKSQVAEENTFAGYIDLNNDGVSEIVGYSTSPYWSKKGYPFYILKKDNQADEYVKIDFVLKIDPNKPLGVLNEKSHGFLNLRVWAIDENKPVTVKYDGAVYSIMRL